MIQTILLTVLFTLLGVGIIVCLIWLVATSWKTKKQTNTNSKDIENLYANMDERTSEIYRNYDEQIKEIYSKMDRRFDKLPKLHKIEIEGDPWIPVENKNCSEKAWNLTDSEK